MSVILALDHLPRLVSLRFEKQQQIHIRLSMKFAMPSPDPFHINSVRTVRTPRNFGVGSTISVGKVNNTQ